MMRELLAAYPPAAGRYDEMLAPDGAPRAHWKPLFDQILASGPEAMRERAQWVQRQIREAGVTYNIYADPEGADRPWELDLLPLILPADEWAGIEAAVAQRATLLNQVLLDVYGEQRLIAEGLLPPALIYGHAGFLRPCRGIPARGDVMLHHYAADLARSPDGRWWVVGDRTQAPSGAGYALENRLVISRLFPDLFGRMKVQRLAAFFATLRESLAYWAPQDRGAPLTVLLTSGPYNETYFEHAYLARYLGLPLVEGSDLTVRDGKVWMKTLSGLQRVHVILRRQDDDYCDPLELRSDSALGIGGLVDAVRRGNVLVANALGSNLLESGGLLGYLPRLSERVLGEPLRMPSVATWWCGEPAAQREALANLDRIVIKGAFPQARVEPMFGEDLDERGRKRVAAMIAARPQMYIAQELVQHSRAPVCDAEQSRQLVGRAIGLRVYACASPNGYMVMPGGLARAATGPDARVISMQRGGSSKDTWVLAAGAVNPLSLLRRETQPQDLVRSGRDLSSRVAENLFWFGRHAERCEDTARLLRLALMRLIEEAPAERARAWPGIAGLLRFCGLATDAELAGDDAAVARALRESVVDEAKPGLASALKQQMRVASQLRERLSLDNWRALNAVARRLQRNRGRTLAIADALAELDQAIAAFMTLTGFTLDGMTRDPGWHFMSLGRRIERLQFLCAMLQQALAQPADADLAWLLELADSSITYRSRYMARPEWLPVLDLLVRDVTNPRSIAFQMKGLQDFLQRIERRYGASLEEKLDGVTAALEGLDPGADLRHGSARLAQALEDFYQASYRLSEQLGLRFFAHVGEIHRQTFAV